MVPFIIIAAAVLIGIVIIICAVLYAFHDFQRGSSVGFNYPDNQYSKGARGEAQIVWDLVNLNSWGYIGRGLRNVYVPYHGKVTEIDVLYITSKGIIVVESKNYSGYVFGSEDQRQWTAAFRTGRYGESNKHKFYNPIWQNRTHIKALQEYLGGVKAFSFVVFGTNCELMNVSYNPESVCVCRENEFRGIIKYIFECSSDVYSPDAVEAMYNRLLPLTYVSEEIKMRHIDSVRAAREACPRCGGKLVLRTVKKGQNAGRQFYGCSNYPSCRFTREAGTYSNQTPSGWIL